MTFWVWFGNIYCLSADNTLANYHNGFIEITVVYMHTCDTEGTWTDAGYCSCQVGIIDIACVC